MDKLFQGLKKLLDDPKTSLETKEAIRKMLQDEKERQQRLARDLDKIIRK